MAGGERVGVGQIGAGSGRPLPSSLRIGMADAHERLPDGERLSPARRVLVTGAAGSIGSYFARRNASRDADHRFDLLLMVHDQDGDEARQAIAGCGEIVEGDICDLTRMTELCGDVDTVLHLAGNPSPYATWAELRAPNIDGVYTTMVAARAAECRRLVYASSIHAVSGYPKGRQVRIDTPPNPGDLYGVTKAFGEAMGRCMAVQAGLPVIAVRICAFQPESAAADPDNLNLADGFVSRPDLDQLLRLCIADRTLRFGIVHGTSSNAFNRLDVCDTRELLGYAPRSDFAELHPDLDALDLKEAVMDHDESDQPDRAGIRDDLRSAQDR